jgi:MFS family permease
LWFAIWALYLTGPARLSGGEAGLALTVAGAVGFLAPTPLGRAADRRGPREVYSALLLAEGGAVLGFLVCRSFLAVLLVAALTAACDQGKTGVRAALVTQLAPAEGRVEALACLRSCAHAGDAIGAGLGALVIGIGSAIGYDAAILLNGLTYVAYAVAVRRVPHVPPCPGAATRRLRAVRDLPYVTLAALCGVLTLCWGLLSAGLPLWIVRDTAAPHALAGAVMLVSSLAISTLQMRFSRRCATPCRAALVALRSGLSLAVCCALFALAAGRGALAATLLVLAGTVAHVLGELWFVAASWGLSVPLMPADRPAEYQGVFATGEALAIMLAPVLMTAVVVPDGVVGWLLLGLGFALAGGAASPAARWALRTRPAPGAAG